MKYIQITFIGMIFLVFTACSHSTDETTQQIIVNPTESTAPAEEAITQLQETETIISNDENTVEINTENWETTDTSLESKSESQTPIEISIDETASPEEAAALEEIESLFNEILES